MSVTIVKDSSTAIELALQLEVSADALNEFVAQAYAYIAQREGIHVTDLSSTKAAVITKLTEPIALEMVTNAVMNMASPFGRNAMKDAVTVGSPLFPDRGKLEEGKPFRFSACWAKLPQVELDSYEPVEIEVPHGEASEADIDERINELLRQGVTHVADPSKKQVENGDVVNLKLQASLKGEPIEGLCFDERIYTTGVGNMPREFEDNIIGMAAGETKTFTFEGLADFDEDENPIMDTYEATATVLSVMRDVLPELTDAWVKNNVQGCNTVNQLREQIRQELTLSGEEEMRHYVNYVAASKLGERFSGRIPDAAYEAVRDEIHSQFSMDAARAGMTPDQYMADQGMDEQQFSIRVVLQARERLVQSISLDAWARHFRLTVGEADLDEFFKASAGQQAPLMRKQFEGSGRMYLAYEGARRLKANDHLVKNAIIREK